MYDKLPKIKSWIVFVLETNFEKENNLHIEISLYLVKL